MGQPLTPDEHRDLARELRTTTARMHELSGLVASVYGPDSRATFAFQKTAEALERLRRELQTQASTDWPAAHSEKLY
jgi:hypothetical protein